MDHPVEDTRAPRVIFIGGTGRSGTNISKALLAKHPQVAALPFEYRFIIDPDGIVDFYQSYTATWSPYLADRRLKRLENLLNTLAAEPLLHKIFGNLLRILNRDGKIFSPRRYHGWGLNSHLPNFRKYSRQLIAELKEFSFSACWVGTESYKYQPQVYHAGPISKKILAQILGNFIERIINDFLAQHNKQIYVEDNTWNILFARELLQLIPQAKILHVYRDPRDVVASIIQQRWCPSDTQQAALWYRSIMTHWFTVRAELPPDSYCEYSLEDLANSTEQVANQICRFVDIPYHSDLLTINLNRSNQGRWRQEFTRHEQQMLQNNLGDIIEKLGYEPR